MPDNPDDKAGTDAKAPRRPIAARGKPAQGAASNPFRVVAIGASAGGLEACTGLLSALPTLTDMAFILVQHLDPTHKSVLVDLLTKHTALAVLQATDGMPVEPEHLYVIPPGTYLSASAGTLRLAAAAMRDGAPHGARLPFDALLQSLAAQYKERVTCVILSGTGSDGTAGLKAVKEAGGLVIVQDPEEAGYDGMPRSAIATELVDAILPIRGIPEALVAAPSSQEPQPQSQSGDGLDPFSAIIDLLHASTRQDFASYKRGTLQRRIERRMGLVSVGGDLGRYLDLLRSDDGELNQLARDLLIHVTRFFREPAASDALAKTVIPGLLRDQPADEPLRIWVAGCSTGEEAYSLIILFKEAVADAHVSSAGPGDRRPDINLQVFASDIDADAVATARAGLYPATIATDVSAERLARFFTREDDHGYRVNPDLRASVVFTVQDLLTDPPFSRLHLVSCRNVMIYLGAEAQNRALGLFHFALKEGGALLLGSAESVADGENRFELIDASARLYRQVGPRRPRDVHFSATTNRPRAPSRLTQLAAPSRQTVLAELCRQAVLNTHAPATVLCNARHEFIYALGPTERYLRVPPGHGTADLLAMVQGPLRRRLRSTLVQVAQGGVRVTVPGGNREQANGPVPFSIDISPLSSDGEDLLLVCFVDLPQKAQSIREVRAVDGPRIAELERELDGLRADLDAAHHIIETSREESLAINEEALSVNEEYQSTNEELVTSKEELQSLNEELQVLNSQVGETLARERTVSNDLQNILYNSDVATLFLDRDLCIRFFTPATRGLVNVIPSDIGRPLADLHSLATDVEFPADARVVLQSSKPAEREVETPGGAWFRRRILPYRTNEGGVEGVVITFNDITRRKQEAVALEQAKQTAEAADHAKSRFLAAASHDLRQPLQTLALLQGLLARGVTDGTEPRLVQRLDETLGAMTSMLDALLDLNQIEVGIVQAELTDFRIGGLLDRLRDEFGYGAQAKELDFRVMPCSALVHTDPRLLEQMLRNLISNGLKYTEHGRVLVGCRRAKNNLRVEVWDTGIGIPDSELHSVFEEYHQIGNEARERAPGLGLGLSIVQRLGTLLDHRVQVRSQPGKGSVFTVEVALASNVEISAVADESAGTPLHAEAALYPTRAGTILVIEDDPDMRDLLRLALESGGYAVTLASTGAAAVDMTVRSAVRPDLVLADYNLPGGITGLQAVARLREVIPGVPGIILTGDTSAGTRRATAQQGLRQLNKPVRLTDLLQMVAALLSTSSVPSLLIQPAVQADKPVVFIVDDDSNIRAMLRAVLEEDGHLVEDYSGGQLFLAALANRVGVLVVDAAMPDLGGLDVLQRLNAAGRSLPAIVITGHGDVAMAVSAMKAGAMDFIEKPVSAPELLASVGRALSLSRDAGERATWQAAAASSIAALSSRERQVMNMVLAGHPSKNIAADLGLSQRTVDNHRASIMRKTGTSSLPALARLALAAATGRGDLGD